VASRVSHTGEGTSIWYSGIGLHQETLRAMASAPACVAGARTREEVAARLGSHSSATRSGVIACAPCPCTGALVHVKEEEERNF